MSCRSLLRSMAGSVKVLCEGVRILFLLAWLDCRVFKGVIISCKLVAVDKCFGSGVASRNIPVQVERSVSFFNKSVSTGFVVVRRFLQTCQGGHRSCLRCRFECTGE